MSDGAAGRARESAAPVEWNRLELAVRRLLDEYDVLRRRAGAAERRIQELETALRDVASGELDPLVLARRLEATEKENRVLRDRLDRARERVHRILARLDFLEEAR